MIYAFLVGALLIGMPVAIAIIATLLVFMATGEAPYTIRIVATEMFRSLNSLPLLAIPLFVLAGELMNESGITGGIVAFADVLVGRMRAGLALVNIWASVIFADLSGSAVAYTSAIGRVFVPEMERHGYDRSFAAAVTAASSVIGPIIPRSIPVILYALIVSGVSVPALFLAGVVPGLLLATFLSIYVFLIVRVDESSRVEQMRSASPMRALLNGILLFLFAGLFLEGIAAMLVLVPVLHPIAVSLGVDPAHFGILVTFNLMIGLIAPPLGLCLYRGRGDGESRDGEADPCYLALLPGRGRGAHNPDIRSTDCHLVASGDGVLLASSSILCRIFNGRTPCTT